MSVYFDDTSRAYKTEYVYFLVNLGISVEDCNSYEDVKKKFDLLKECIDLEKYRKLSGDPEDTVTLELNDIQCVERFRGTSFIICAEGNLEDFEQNFLKEEDAKRINEERDRAEEESEC